MMKCMSDLFSIKDKIIIITGAGKGIGNYLAKNMAKKHAHVYALSRSSFKKQSTNQSNLTQIKCNVRDKKTFKKICDKIFVKHKKIDVLINNAGITFPKSNSKFYYEKEWMETLQTNLTSAFNCSQIVIGYMLKKKYGSIINVTSINAELGFPNNPAYTASKGGLKMLTKALARDWGKYGIRVNNLGPGYFKTDMNKKTYQNKKTQKSRENQTMLLRWGELEDLLGPCIFLASDASNYVTAHDLYVDGGWVSNGLYAE